ncbi:helicase and polymerase-containing protein TEBICHI [Quillaja saponaria]|uniref:Helicase and polymerase-containing protein TEBICHI n=1 Tax=Quillaja saponaria TaxID=32244 RepID=A0AAD7PT82_QUISA|nr:helicase and polymerase-containing protein TEBICHI [Quillaja saponaria]
MQPCKNAYRVASSITWRSRCDSNESATSYPRLLQWLGAKDLVFRIPVQTSHSSTMASGSPRNRIDKFFPSKKRKTLSPVSNTGRSEKDARHTIEGSPSAKGTLESYLVTSQDDENASKLSHAVYDSLARHDAVKRNLALEINRSSQGEHKQSVFSGQVHSQLTDLAQKNYGEPKVADFTVAGCEKNSSVFVEGAKNLELKQFATDFLSLYCSELQTSVCSPSELKVEDLKKKHSDLSLPDGEGTFKNRSHATIQSHLHGEPLSLSDKNPEDVRSSVVCNTNASVFGYSGKVTIGDNPGDHQSSLKRCSSTPISSMGMTECYTPGSLIVKACVRETPKSTRGSSIFSPGEAFWNEAIQLVDGLSAPMVSEFVEATGGRNLVEAKDHMKSSSNLRDYDGKTRKILDEGERRISNMEIGTSALPSKHTRDSVEEVSALPVKHFDFSCEDNNLDESTLHQSRADGLKNVTLIGQIQSAHVSLDPKYLRTDNIRPDSCLDQKNQGVNEVQEMASFDVVSKLKMSLSFQGNDCMNSPINEVQKMIDNHASDEANTPTSNVSLNDHLDLNSWLPSDICNIYRKRGISKLYPWQVDCLQVDGVLQRRNLVYCASTSAGKSFVAEILMLRRVISTGKIALLVLPYVSICAEKAEHLELLLEPLGKHVRSYYGIQGGGTLPKDTSIAVCTIEKANSLINRLLEEGRLSEIGIIVIDELHMVGDRSRGYLLELMLTKLRYAAGEGNSELSSGESSGASSTKADPAQGLQIVGMSATMPNVAAVADWLQAALYQTEFRPVPLEEYIKVGNSVYNKKLELVRTISKAADLGGKDPDHIVELCNEVVQEGHSVLIFCSSRKGCESTARHVSKFLKKFSVRFHENDSEFVDITSAINSLRKCPAGLDPVLEETLPSGVAFHHAGLTVEEREIVETCYRRGLLHVLTATSTLAAGVNLPARRVIFRQPRIGRDFIDGTRYKQMAGRAGRTGIDTKGESVLICKPEEIKRGTSLLNESCPPLNSCLSEDMNGMTHAILEVVAGGMVQTANDIHRYVRCTLLNSTKPFQDVVKSAQESLRWLCHRKFLEWNEETKLYSTTPLGRASFGSSLCPEESLIVLDDLSRAREGFVLASDLHLVYLVTPINVDVEPDWELYYERFMQLSLLDQSVGNRVGVTEPFLMRMAHGAPICSSNKSKNGTKWLHGKNENQLGLSNGTIFSDDQTLRVCRRLYVALILSRLVQENPVGEVCEAFRVARGMVQALQENAGRFASMVSVFCERLGWHDLEGLVAKFQNRVSFGVRAEIVELTTIPYIKGSRARALYKAGFRTPLAIAEASIPELVKALFESSSWATEGSAQRRIQLGVAKKIKNGARKIVLDKAEEARVAAFAAFKSLGYNVPTFSPPTIYTAAADSSGQAGGKASSGSDTAGTTHSFVDVEHMERVSSVPSVQGSKISEKVGLEKEREELMKTSDICFMASAKENTNTVMQHKFSAENSVVPVEDSVTLGNELNAAFDPAEDADMTLRNKIDRTMILHDGSLNHGVEEQYQRVNLCPGNVGTHWQKGPISAVNTPGGFDSFLDLWESVGEFFFDIHYNKRLELNSVSPFEIHGIAICWENSPVYYINLPKDLLWSDYRRDECLSLSASSNKRDRSPSEQDMGIARHRWSRIGNIMEKNNVRKFTWNLKVQIQVLKSPAISVQRFGCLNVVENWMGLELVDSSYLLLSPIHVKGGIDMCVVAWILWPDEERSSNPNLEKEVKKRLSSEAAAAANLSGRWKNQMRRAAHNGCCRRVAQTRTLCSVLWKLIISEELVEVLMELEIPLVNILADMELWGIGVDLEGCIQARKSLVKKLRYLEKEAYKLAGMTFSLHTVADIANVLYEHLKLPIPEKCNKGKHPSTDKHCLEILRDEHPIVPVIKEHRSLAKLLNCTLGSISSLARLSVSTQKYTLHGHWLQTSTATGRLSMEEPNLQCVEHMVEFKMSQDKNGGDADDDHYRINARDFFVPTQINWLLLTADYSQIELRLMAHFSKDSSLIELLGKPHGDVFTMIAARWIGCPEDSIDSNQREQTKRMVYGILYGMGANSLSEQLGCSSDEAAEKIQDFKHSFPGVESWLRAVVASCRQKGYVKTLKGRKRFLSKIKFGDRKEKSKAQRQAVNSICQGSAADIIKIAMIKIYSVIVEGVDSQDSSSALATKSQMLRGRCRILLQVHDELVLEVDPSIIKEAALLLKNSMENAALLLVPLHVKLKVGRTWGSLEPFTVTPDN